MTIKNGQPPSPPPEAPPVAPAPNQMAIDFPRSGPGEHLLDNLEPFDPDRALTILEAAQRMRGRRTGKRLNVHVARRWAKYGCRPAGPDGPLLYLPSVKLNGVILVMEGWVRAFEIARVQVPLRVRQIERAHVAGLRSPAQARRDHEAAVIRLRAAGIGCNK